MYFVAATLLYVAGQMLSAYRWQLLTALIGMRGPFVDFLSFYFVGMFTNLFVPGFIGGDAARVLYLGRRRKAMGKALASVVADRSIGLTGLCWFAAATAIVLKGGFLPASVVWPTLAVGFVMLLALVLAPLIARLIPLMPRRLRATAELVGPYLRHPAGMLPAIGLSLVLHGSQAVCQYILAIGLGLGFPLTMFLLCVPIANVFAALPVTLNGLGVRETVYLVLFGFAGMSKVDAIALGLLWFASTMIGGLTGAIAFMTTEMPTLREAPATADTVESDPAN